METGKGQGTLWPVTDSMIFRSEAGKAIKKWGGMAAKVFVTEAYCFWPEWLTTQICLKPLPSLHPSLKFPSSTFNPLKHCLFFNAYISLNYKVFMHQKSSPTEVQISELCTWYAKIIPSDLSLYRSLPSISCSSCISYCPLLLQPSYYIDFL